MKKYSATPILIMEEIMDEVSKEYADLVDEEIYRALMAPRILDKFVAENNYDLIQKIKLAICGE
jgi:hypothetical protein